MSYHARRIIRNSAPVQRALELGWKPFDSNKTARKHFYFTGPARFEAHIAPDGALYYTVDHDHSSYVPKVLELLEKVVQDF